MEVGAGFRRERNKLTEMIGKKPLGGTEKVVATYLGLHPEDGDMAQDLGWDDLAQASIAHLQ